jgi:hypothetical protein
MDWNDPEVNPAGLKLVEDPRKSVPVIVAARVLAHFKDASGNSFVFTSIGTERKMFKATQGAYEEVNDTGLVFVAARMTDELLNRRR